MSPALVPALLVSALAAGPSSSQPEKKPAPTPNRTPAAPARTPESAAPEAAPPAKPAPPLLPFPHPVITEVLYAVPTGLRGDASGDGNRAVAGDEFVEIWNPHDRPINLKGYVITDGNEAQKGQFKFVFPSCELRPGQCAVVFNGDESKWESNIGDATRAAGPNEKFAGALVFTAKNTSSRTAFNNTADMVLLSDPAGKGLEAISWGGAKLPAGRSFTINEDVPVTNAQASVQRKAPGGPFIAHADLDGKPFSPGVFGPAAAANPAPTPTPDPKAAPTGKK
ncbi:MAG: lamin tail domain-containing protein [Phycisphaerae bacterium]|nr:lamin tail domain-containing protein [Phycisphaerae bacterium]